MNTAQWLLLLLRTAGISKTEFDYVERCIDGNATPHESNLHPITNAIVHSVLDNKYISDDWTADVSKKAQAQTKLILEQQLTLLQKAFNLIKL